MDIRTCRICGKLFQTLGDRVCLECAEELDRCFIKVREYLYAHKNADIVEIARHTGVKERYILDFLKEERLSIAAAAGLSCERCGSPIETGRMCNACKETLSRALRTEPAKQEAPAKRDRAQQSGKWGKMYVDYRKL